MNKKYEELYRVSLEKSIRVMRNFKELQNFWKRKKEYVTINELIKLYPAFSKNRIYDMINGQGLKHINGKPILIDRDDFIEFLDTNKVTEVNTIEQEYNTKYKYINMPQEKIRYV